MLLGAFVFLVGLDSSKRDAGYEERVPIQFIESSLQTQGTRYQESFTVFKRFPITLVPRCRE